MSTSVESLQLMEIREESLQAYNATEKLFDNVKLLSTSLKRLDITRITSMSSTFVQSSEAAREATKNTSGWATAIEKVGQKIPNIKKGIEGFCKRLPDVKKAMEGIYKATESTENYFKSFNYYTDTFAEIASKWDEDFEIYGSENARKYSNTFIQQMNESLGKLSGMKVSLSVDMEGGTLTKSGMKDLGLNVQEVTQFAAELASITNSLGQTGDVSLATADAFTKLAGDMSSYYNVDYSQVVNDLKNALSGQTDVLSKYKIFLSDATLETYAYSHGLEKSVDEMTEAEKMQLSLIGILEQSENTWGNLANNINTPANALRELTNNCKEVINVLGQLFVPVLEKILPVISGIVMGIENLLTSIAGIFGIEINMSDMGTGTDDIATGLEVYAGEENTYAPNPSGSITLSEGILAEVARYEEVWNQAYDNMEKKSQQFADKVTAFLEPVKSIFSNLAVGDYFSVGQNVGVLVISITDFLKNAIDSVDWHAVGEMIGEFFEGINWTEVFSSVGELIGEAIGSAFEVLDGVFDAAPIETMVIGAIGLLKWSGLGKAITSGNLFNNLAALLSGQLLEGNGIFSKLGNVFALTIGGAGNFGESLATEFEGLAPVVAKITEFGKKAEPVISSIGNHIGTVVKQIAGGISMALNSVGTFIQSIITFLQPFAAAIAGVTAIIAGIALAVTNFITMFQEGFSWLNEAIMLVGIALVAVGAVLLGAPALVAGIVAAIVAVVSTLVVVIHENWDAICTFFSSAVEWIYTNIIIPIGEFFVALWMGIADACANLWEGISAVWISVSTWFSANVITPVKSAFKNACDGIGGFFSALWSGIKSGLASAMNAVIGGVESGINFIINGVNKIIKGFNKVVSWAAEVAGMDWDGVSTIATVKLARISVYASGGFPEDGWFRASHGEYFGKFDDGTSYIANNRQITSGVASGVASAVRDANAEQNALLREQNILLRQILEKDTGISTRAVFEAVRAENRNFISRTGESAFAF